jgi:hypothetical protein
LKKIKRRMVSVVVVLDGKTTTGTLTLTPWPSRPRVRSEIATPS